MTTSSTPSSTPRNLSENDVYNRIYDAVLPAPEFKDKTDELLGNIDVPPG